MKNNIKSSITLPPSEMKLVLLLMKNLGIHTKVEVVRQGLNLLKETADRKFLEKEYAIAARKLKKATKKYVEEFDHLSGESLTPTKNRKNES